MPTKADLTATLAGGGAGFLLLQSVKWEAMPYQLGEPLKLITALGIILGGILIYRGKETK